MLVIVKCIAACVPTTHLSSFNRLPVIQPVSSKVRHFSTFLHILASPWYENRGKCYMDAGFNAGQTHNTTAYTHLSSTVYEL